MANIKVKHSAVGTADGASWANAKVDLLTATSASVAGDTLEFSQAHAESTVGAVSATLPGTSTSPMRLVCVNDSNETPTAVATTATITSESTISLKGSFHAYGLTFRAGQGASVTQGISLGIGSANNIQLFEKCSLQIMTTGTGAALITVGDEARTDGHKYVWQDHTVRFGGVNNRIKLVSNFRWDGGGIVNGSATPTSIFSAGSRTPGDATVNNVDFSPLGASANIMVQTTAGDAYTLKLRNCILPASGSGAAWTGNLWSALPTVPGYRVEMYNCFSASTKIRMRVADAAGQAWDDTVVVRTAGAVDDGVPFSYKLFSSANARYPVVPLDTPPLKAYVNSANSPVTFSVEIVHDAMGSGVGGRLQDHEIGLRAIYPGGTKNTFKVDVLATPVSYTDSTEAWTTTGITTPVKQKISITFTPTSKGEVLITPVLFATSKTVYLCPKLGA